MRIRPALRINGRLELPGDKAISHRAAIAAALARGTSLIERFSTGEDAAATLSCLNALGVHTELSAGLLRVEGVGLDGFRAPLKELDCRNSGSTMRMLAGLLAGQNFESVLTGDESLRGRPMRRIIEPLELMGAHIESLGGRAPLRITGRVPLKSITYELPVASAQLKSCIILAGLKAKGRTRVIEPAGMMTRDHTERMLSWYGANIRACEVVAEAGSANEISIEPPFELRAREFRIPGDISSAAFFIAAACLLPGSRLILERVGLNPTRTQFLQTLLALGADMRVEVKVESGGKWMELDEAYGEISVRGAAGLAPRKPNESNLLRGAQIPGLIDELPVLAVLGTQVLGGFSIRDARELRVKETDRIAAMVKNLRAMGVSLEEHEDGLTIRERTRLRGARLKAYGDHRVAMACTVAALLADGESELDGAECVAISFPEFYRLLESVTER